MILLRHGLQQQRWHLRQRAGLQAISVLPPDALGYFTDQNLGVKFLCDAKWVHVPASGAVWLPYGKTSISLYMPDEKSAPEIAFQGVVPIYSSKLQKLVPSTASKALTEWQAMQQHCQARERVRAQ